MIPAILITTAFWCVAVIAVRVLITSHRAALKAKPEPDALDALVSGETSEHPFRTPGEVRALPALIAPERSPAEIACKKAEEANARKIQDATRYIDDAYRRAREYIDQQAAAGSYVALVAPRDMGVSGLSPMAIKTVRDLVMTRLITDKFHVTTSNDNMVVQWAQPQ